MHEIITHVSEELSWLDPPPVFVGGAIISLYLDSSSQLARATYDVDLIVPAIQTRAQWLMLEQELYKRGWQPDPTVRHTCRYISPINKAAVDLMAEQPSALGFAGRWYPEAVRHAGLHRLRTGCTIRIPSAPHLLACKLEAYRDRGRADPWTSTDLEDIVTLVDGRPSLLHEVGCSDVILRTWLASEVSDLIANPVVFRDLAGYLSGGDPSGREHRLRRTLTALAASPS